MSYTPEDEEEPPVLRRLRLLVMVLIVALILGIVTIAATIVIRLGFGVGDGDGSVAAESINLPPGEVVSMGQGDGTVMFVLRGDDGAERLLIFSGKTGEFLSETTLDRK